jgi:hypothetical protein
VEMAKKATIFKKHFKTLDERKFRVTFLNRKQGLTTSGLKERWTTNNK